MKKILGDVVTYKHVLIKVDSPKQKINMGSFAEKD